MPKKAAITPNKHLHTTIPADLAARLDLFLWSEVEGRVPQGAYQSFVCDSIRNFFNTRTIDIGPQLGIPSVVLISGTAEALDTLIKALEARHGT